jgi:hypothetical protein
MLALLASLVVFAAGETAPAVPVPLIPDPEVPRYLNTAERAEWGRALRQVELGQARMQQGTSIMNAPRIETKGAFAETAEQVKARAQKIIDEGRNQLAQAQPSLTRLRNVAGTRHLEVTKTVNLNNELPQTLWNYSLTLAAVRLQKIARDQGFRQQHLVGAITVLEGSKPLRTSALTDQLRAAWNKADAKALAPVPTAGYGYSLPSGDGPANLSPEWKAPTAARQVAVVWAEVYPLVADNSASVLFVRMADAYTMRVIASEVYLTTTGPADAFPKVYTATLSLKDEKSFIPRLAGSGDWVLSYDRSCSPLGAALMRHLCVRVGNLGVGASQPLVDVLGGDVPSLDGAKASWTIVAEGGSNLVKAFKVTSAMTGAEKTDVGQLVLKLEEPAKPAAK